MGFSTGMRKPSWRLMARGWRPPRAAHLASFVGVATWCAFACSGNRSPSGGEARVAGTILGAPSAVSNLRGAVAVIKPPTSGDNSVTIDITDDGDACHTS
jgi:hypothetical protein